LELTKHYKYLILQDMLYKLLQLLNNYLSYMQYLKMLMNKVKILLDIVYKLIQLSKILMMCIMMHKQR